MHGGAPLVEFLKSIGAGDGQQLSLDLPQSESARSWLFEGRLSHVDGEGGAILYTSFFSVLLL